MPTDRDLITDTGWLRESAQAAAVAEDATMPVDPVVVLALLDALEKARSAIDEVQAAHEMQLTRLAKDRAKAARKIERLKAEAAPRPPLGYVVLSRNPDSGRLQPHGRVHDEVEHAGDWRQHLQTPGGPRIPICSSTEFLVAELREVKP